MRTLLRRGLWLLPMLILATLLGFASLGTQSSGGLDADPLPLLFNSDPRDVRLLALRALEQIAQTDRTELAARRTLARLGGAALPHVLPRMDRLSPPARVRMALGLAPVGRRMHIGTEDELVHPDQAVLFWSRFWEDRALDFRPAVAKRLAKRVAERASITRREEILGLDTYALPALMDELGVAVTPADVARVERITSILCQITEHDWRLHQPSDLAEARALAERWQSWWSHHRYEYVPLDGPRRIGAMWFQTRYGQWAAEAVRAGLSPSILERLGRSSPMTIWLLLVALVGGWLGGTLVGLVTMAEPRTARGRAIGIILPALGAVPAATGSAMVVPAGAPLGQAWWAAWVAVVVTGAVVAWYVRAAARAVRLEEHHRTQLAQGAHPWRIALVGARQVGLLGLSLLAVHLPEVLSAVLLIEQALGLNGIGPLTVAAVRQRDVAWLTLVALLSTTSVWMAQAGGDWLLEHVDPRLVDFRSREPAT